MIVISDTTPIISLIKAGQLQLLETLFGKVMIPEAVYQELTDNISFSKEADIVRCSSFIQVRKVNESGAVNVLRRVAGLDAGESEAIIMAEETGSDILLIDERKGRRVAKQMGFVITGTVGILLEAYDEKLLSGMDVERCLFRMQECGIRIGSGLWERVLSHIKK